MMRFSFVQMKHTTSAFLAVLLLSSCFSSNKSQKIIFYNVENLFDTVDDPGTDDSEFLPESDKKWDEEKYKAKLDHTAEVIIAICGKKAPMLVGLCEVENEKVIYDLITLTDLKVWNLGYVHHDSPDERGIEVALLYNKDFVSILQSEVEPVVFDDPNDKTRDVIMYHCALRSGDTLYAIVNHWPSRIGGDKETEPKRITAAQTVMQHVDRAYQLDANANIVIMGDFNDEPDNISIHDTLNAKSPAEVLSDSMLVNLMFEKQMNGEGSYYYKSDWNMLDQFIVSWAVFNGTQNLQADQTDAHIFKDDFLMFLPEKGDPRPNRTYGGDEYYGGYSDHLAIYLELQIIK